MPHRDEVVSPATSRHGRHIRPTRGRGGCAACGHDWREHSGTGGVPLGDGCSECDYEVEHQQRDTADPPCSLSVLDPVTGLRRT